MFGSGDENGRGDENGLRSFKAIGSALLLIPYVNLKASSFRLEMLAFLSGHRLIASKFQAIIEFALSRFEYPGMSW